MRLPITMLMTVLICSVCAFGAPPNPPVIYEPVVDGQIVNAADVHMVSNFSDPDPGNTHQASDYEIWNDALTERVWRALNVTGVAKVHVHFGDGVFENSLFGKTQCNYSTPYRLKVRHQDNTGLWGNYSIRSFITGAQTQVFPMETEDVATVPAPLWKDGSNNDVILPTAATQPYLRIESEDGVDLLLEYRGLNGTQNQITNPAALISDVNVRVLVYAGSLASGLVKPQSTISFTDGHGEAQVIYLPSISLANGQSTVYWVSVNGSTYQGNISQTTPDFSTLVRGAPVPWTLFASNFKVEVVAAGLRMPTHIAFKPNAGPNPTDPLYYVTELHDGVKVIRRNGVVSTYASNMLNYVASGQFSGPGEVGVTGITVAPNGDLYVGLMYSPSGATNGPWTARIVRMTSVDGGLTAATTTTIIDDAPNLYSYSHVVGTLTIGPDVKLYAQIGEGNTASAAQVLEDFRGKILRVNLDGTAPTDNPFYTTPTAKRSFVWAYGYRNPFGGAWRDVGTSLYTVENGPSSDRLSKPDADRNNNWGTAGDSDGQMYHNAINIWSPAHAPTAMAFIQASSNSYAGFPALYYDNLFVCESGPTYATGPQTQGKRIVSFTLDAAGNKLTGPTDFAVYTGSGKATALGLAAGPDGLYFTDLYKDLNGAADDPGGNVLRIKFTGVGGIAGTVRDTSNNPISGASVTTTPGGFTTTTAGNGTYLISNVSTGTYFVTATKAGYSTVTRASVAVVQDQTTQAIDFNIQVGVTNGTISGLVRDASNNPLIGATVSTTTGGYTTTTAADGSYVLAGVAAATYSVQASKSGFITGTNSNVIVTAGQTKASDFALSPVAPFSGVNNGSFEGGFYNNPDVDHQSGTSWTRFSISGSSKAGGVYGTYHSANWSQAIYEAAWVAGVYQQATNAIVGNNYTGSVWVRGSDTNVKFWVGVDPTGATNAAGASVQWSAQAAPGATWTQISKQVQATASTITIFLKAQNTQGFNLYAYLDDAALVDNGPGGPVPPTITRSPATLSPSVQQGGNAANQTFTVQNTGQGTLNYSITDNVTWLSAAPASGTSTGEVDTITVSYTTSSLGVGTHNGTITITDAAASNNPQTIAVTLTVTAPPTITRSPATLAPACTVGTNAANQTFTVQNTGGGTLNYSITDNVTWLAVSPTSGTSTGEVDTMTVSYTTNGLGAGTHNATITITDAGASNSPQTIAVTLTVTTALTVAEDFNSVPAWTSFFDAAWGGQATWSSVTGGQAGNHLQATRGNNGSSSKVMVYNITANTNYTISIYMKGASSTSTYWVECAYKMGSNTAQNFDASGGTWTMIKKFENVAGSNGNGDVWTIYTKTFNSGASTQISVGFKMGLNGGTAPTARWDTLRIQ